MKKSMNVFFRHVAVRAFFAFAAWAFSATALAKTVYVECTWSSALDQPASQAVQFFSGSSKVGEVVVTKAGGWRASGTVSSAYDSVKAVANEDAKATVSQRDYGCKAFGSLAISSDTVHVRDSDGASEPWISWLNDRADSSQIEGWNGWQSVASARSSNSAVYCKPASGGDPIYVVSNTKLPGVSYSATGYEGYVDGKAHSITVVAHTPGASVQYSSSSSSGPWSDVNPSYSAVGTHTVYFRVSCAGYVAAVDSRKVNILEVGNILCSAEGYSGPYDGATHRISVTVTQPSSGATVMYSTNGGSSWSYTNPGFSTGTHEVHYKVTATGYTQRTGSAIVDIKNRELTCTAIGYTGQYDGYSHGISVSVSSSLPPSNYTRYYSVDGVNWRTSNYTYTNVGVYKVYCKVVAVGYEESNVSYANVTITEGTLHDGYILDGSYTNGYVYSGHQPWYDRPGYYRVRYGTNYWGVGIWYVYFDGDGGFTGTVTRTFRVLPRAASIVSGSKSKQYDGTPLEYDYVSTSGFVSGEGLASKSAFGSQTDVGASPNYFTYKFKDNTDPGNYTINVSTGRLDVWSVKPKSLRYPVRLDISGPEQLDVGVSKNYKAYVTYSDGTSNTVSSTWSLDPGEPKARFTSSSPTSQATLLALPKGAGSKLVVSVPYSETFGTGAVVDGLMAWYPFDDSTAYDMGVYRQNGQRKSSLQVTRFADRANASDRAYRFSGESESYVYASRTPQLASVTNALTVSAWICPEAASEQGILFRSATSLDLSIRPDGTWKFNGTSYSTGVGFAQGEWQLATLTWDGSYLCTYRNGVQTGKFPLTGSVSAPPEADLVVGRSSGAAFTGAMDDVRIYNRAISPAEIELIRRGVDVTAETATVTVSAEKTVSVCPTCCIQVAVDVESPHDSWRDCSSGQTFTTGSTAAGGKGWYGQYETVYGVYSESDYDAAQSGATPGGSTSWMKTSVTGAGTVSFWWKTDCEQTYDYLVFKDNGTELARLSGTNGWKWLAFSLQDGSHDLRWEYVKDAKNSVGKDAAWVDRFEWSKLSVPRKPSGVSSLVRATDGTYDTCVYVEWDEPISEWPVTAYQVYRNGEQLSGELTARAFSDTNAVPGAEYSYEVKAKNASGWGSCGSDPGYRRVTIDVKPESHHFSNVSVGESALVAVTSNTTWKATTVESWLHVTMTNGGFVVTADNTSASFRRTGKVTVTGGIDGSGKALKYSRSVDFSVSQSARIDVSFAKPYNDWRTELQVTTNGLVEVDAYSPVSVFAPADDMKMSFGWMNDSDVEVELTAVKFRVYDESNAKVQEWTDNGGDVVAGMTLGAHSKTNCAFWSGAHLKALKPGDYKLEAELDPENVLDDPDRLNNKAIFRLAVRDTLLGFGTDVFVGDCWYDLASAPGSDFAQAPHVATRQLSYTNAVGERLRRDAASVQFGPYVPMNGENGREITIKKPVDIVFLIDFTGSMDQCIAGLMNNIGVFIDRLLVGDPARGISPISDLRIKIAGFSDYRSDCSYKNWFEEGEFTADRRKLREKLEELRNQCYGGGGNAGESSYDALYYICKGWGTVWDPLDPVQPDAYVAYDPDEEEANGHLHTFRGTNVAARAVVMFTDEPPHAPMDAPGCPKGASGHELDGLKAALEEEAINLTIIGDGFYYRNYEEYADNIHWLGDLTNACAKAALIETGDGSSGGTIASFTQDTSRLQDLAETIYLQVPEEATIEEPTFTATACGEGTLSFRWCNDSTDRANTTFTFTCEEGSLTRKAEAPDPSWDPLMEYKFGEGTHPFRWSYKKIDYAGSVSDCGLVADITWKPETTMLYIDPTNTVVDCLGTNKEQVVTNDVKVVDGVVHYETNRVNGAMFRVTCNAAWKVVRCPDWIIPVLGSGEGNGMLVVNVAPNDDFMERTGFIEVAAGDYGLPSDVVKRCLLKVVQEGGSIEESDKVRVLKVDVKPRWPWSRFVDIDFWIQVPTNGNADVWVKFWGLNKEGGDLVDRYPVIAGLKKCPAKKNGRHGFVYSKDQPLLNTTDADGMYMLPCPVSGYYRFSWDMEQDWKERSDAVSYEKSQNSNRWPWKSKSFHTPEFSVELMATNLAATAKSGEFYNFHVFAPTNTVRVDMRLDELNDLPTDDKERANILPGGTILSGWEYIGHPWGEVDPKWYDTREKFHDQADGWKALDFVDKIYGTYTSRTDRACIINSPTVAIEGGTISSNVTWGADKVHVVRDNVFVAPGATLTIDEDAVVKICGCTRIYVPGHENILVKGCFFPRAYDGDELYGGDTLCFNYMSTKSTEGLSEGEGIVYSPSQYPKKTKDIELDEIVGTSEYKCSSNAIAKVELAETYAVVTEDGALTAASNLRKRYRYYSCGQPWGDIPGIAETNCAFFGWFTEQPTSNNTASNPRVGKDFNPTNYVAMKNKCYLNPTDIPYKKLGGSVSPATIYALVCPTNWGAGVTGVEAIATSATNGVVTLQNDSAIYDGAAHYPKISTVFVNGKPVQASFYEEDYGEYANGFVTAGVYRVMARFKSSYTGSPYATYTILPRPVDGGKVVFSPTNTLYRPASLGGVATPAETVSLTGNVATCVSWSEVDGVRWSVIDKLDYTVDWLDDKNWPWPGTYHAEIRFNDNYSGTLARSFVIEKNPYYDFTSPRTSVGTADAAVAAAKSGSNSKRILYFGSEIPEDAETEYVKALITDDIPFNEWVIDNFVVWTNDVTETDSPYGKFTDGMTVTAYPLICVLNPDDPDRPIARTCGFMEKSELREFLETALSGKSPASLATVEFKSGRDVLTYTGVAAYPSVNDVEVRYAGTLLAPSQYEVVPESESVDVGTYFMAIRMKSDVVVGDYVITGETAAVSYTIAPLEVSDASGAATLAQLGISLDPASSVYNGEVQRPEVVTTTVEYASFDYGTDDWCNAGNHVLTVAFDGNYKGTITKTFAILQKSVSAVIELDRYSEAVVDGKATASLKPNVLKVSDEATGYAYAEGTDYDLSFLGGFDAAGTNWVVATFKGNYSGEARARFVIEGSAAVMDALENLPADATPEQVLAELEKFGWADARIYCVTNSASEYDGFKKWTEDVGLDTAKGAPHAYVSYRMSELLDVATNLVSTAGLEFKILDVSLDETMEDNPCMAMTIALEDGESALEFTAKVNDAKAAFAKLVRRSNTIDGLPSGMVGADQVEVEPVSGDRTKVLLKVVPPSGNSGFVKIVLE